MRCLLAKYKNTLSYRLTCLGHLACTSIHTGKMSNAVNRAADRLRKFLSVGCVLTPRVYTQIRNPRSVAHRTVKNSIFKMVCVPQTMVLSVINKCVYTLGVLTAHTHQVCEDTDLGEELKRPLLRLTTLGKIPVLLLSLLLLTCACTPKNKYEEMVEAGLASKVRYDSLFFGLHFNMTADEFFQHCFEMNQQGIFFQNPNGTEVQYKFKNEFKDTVIFNFFPNLENKAIHELRGHLYYQHWTPYQKKYSADSLQLEVVELFERWYGGTFVKIPNPQELLGDIYVKIDGNRKISIYNNLDNRKVEVWFVDISKIEKNDEALD